MLIALIVGAVTAVGVVCAILAAVIALDNDDDYLDKWPDN